MSLRLRVLLGLVLITPSSGNTFLPWLLGLLQILPPWLPSSPLFITMVLLGHCIGPLHAHSLSRRPRSQSSTYSLSFQLPTQPALDPLSQLPLCIQYHLFKASLVISRCSGSVEAPLSTKLLQPAVWECPPDSPLPLPHLPYPHLAKICPFHLLRALGLFVFSPSYLGGCHSFLYHCRYYLGNNLCETSWPALHTFNWLSLPRYLHLDLG